jgi:hypothetical protein
MCETSIQIFSSVKLCCYRLNGYNNAPLFFGKPLTELHCVLLINLNTHSGSLYLINTAKHLFPFRTNTTNCSNTSVVQMLGHSVVRTLGPPVVQMLGPHVVQMLGPHVVQMLELL